MVTLHEALPHTFVTKIRQVDVEICKLRASGHELGAQSTGPTQWGVLSFLVCARLLKKAPEKPRSSSPLRRNCVALAIWSMDDQWISPLSNCRTLQHCCRTYLPALCSHTAICVRFGGCGPALPSVCHSSGSLPGCVSSSENPLGLVCDTHN